MTVLAANGLAWSAGGVRILDGVDVAAHRGEVLGVLGPNGAGKTSLLRLLAGLRRPDRGTVTLDGQPMHVLPRRAIAQRLAIVEQAPEAHTDLTVSDAVALGRTPHRRRFAPLRAADHAAIDRALDLTGMSPYRTRSWRTLSGGEQQRTQLARALAQEPAVIVLDEPTNHLDIRYQLDVLALLRRLEMTVVTALHDLNLAARFCDRLAVLDGGRVAAAGDPDAVLTRALIRDVYGVDAVVETSPHTGMPAVTYLGAPARAEGRVRPLPPSV
ncbi:ABC transporter ATP-binding protein [Jiangella alkaliphila]|uniref:Iron complex transport system ATP-binding protein n=1 Tax=Jiangella alkaliphila TaxID=419479 RepID=A0A1H2LDG1_9ACTN|nr:ABC transporter ATP-binding protein [Jiangella alkaliphila]SDU78621.1 iron complex transport system ATP-binding protein [Jiangella alkaliphila]